MGLSRQITHLRQIGQIARLAGRLTRPWRPPFLPMVARATRLCRAKRFTPAEAFRLGLFLPDPPGAGDDCISRKHLTKLQERLNPPSAAAAVRDKGALYRRCLEVGIPIPELYAVFDSNGPPWRPSGDAPAGVDAWVCFIADDLPAEFVIKPTLGSYGRGVRLMTRSGDGFVDHLGHRHTAVGIYEAMADDAAFDGFVIQRRLHNVPGLIDLTGTEALQTIRLVTLLTGDGGCRVVHGHFKPIVGDHVADNVIEGLTGNVEAPVDPATGALGPANHIPASGRGPQTIDRHPSTGRAFAGFRLPLWDEARRLALAAAPHFRPLRTIGWDIALTPDGPIIVEGNVWWDPPNQHANIGPLIRALRAETEDYPERKK